MDWTEISNIIIPGKLYYGGNWKSLWKLKLISIPPSIKYWRVLSFFKKYNL